MRNKVCGSHSRIRAVSGHAAIRSLPENQYGRVYEDTDKDGALSLPAGSYTFTMQTQTGGMTDSFTVSGQSTVSVTFDTKNWLLTDGFQLSSRTKTSFGDGLFPVEVKSGA